MTTLLEALFPGVSRRHVALASALLAALAVALFAAPFSPAALGRADAALGDGDAELAAARYDAVASWSFRNATREEALYRAALVYAVDLHDLKSARARLDRLAAMPLPAVRKAEVEEQLGHVRLADGRPGAAARAFLYAYEAVPQAPQAADRLAAAARAREAAGDDAGADALWQRLGDAIPAARADALIARGELALAKGDTKKALARFEAVSDAEPSGPQRSAARLGVSTCLEHLGDFEGALAEIDASDLPQDVRDRRTDSLRARLAVGGQL